MQPRRIVMLDFADRDLGLEDWQALGALGTVVRARHDEANVSALLADADALLVQLGVGVDRALLESAPRLRYVGVFGTSMGRIDLAACAARDVLVRNVPDFSTEAVAELSIAIMLDHLRGLTGARRRAEQGDLTEKPALGRELRELPVGIVGMGAIGARVASILDHGFGAEVRHWSRTPRELPRTPRMDLDALLARSEIVAVHLALTDETRGLLDHERLARIPSGALLVHLSPLELFDFDALIDRLREGTLSFVTDHGDELSPDALAILSGSQGCTLYPPIGYATDRARAARIEGLIAGLRDTLR